MALDFPASPSNGDYFFSSTLGIYYVYDGVKGLWKVVDTPISVSNADTLEGQPGSYYLNYNNFTNKPTVASAEDIGNAYNQANIATTNADGAFIQANTAIINLGLAFDTANLSYDSSNLAYGTANLAYDTANLAFDAANSKANVSDLTTDNVIELTNLYFTEARARESISVSGAGTYDNTTGVITVSGDVSYADLTTANVVELTNLYYTDARVLTGLTSADVQVDSLGVGTAASSTTGEIRATNNITAYYSDRRLKSIHSNIPDALSKVLSLNGVLYVNNDIAASYGYTDLNVQVGVIAQEVQKVLPQAVAPAPFDIIKDENGVEISRSGENYLTVRYEKLVPLLIEAIKQQQQQIDELIKVVKT